MEHRIRAVNTNNNQVSDYLLFRKVVKVAKELGVDEIVTITHFGGTDTKTLNKYLANPELLKKFAKKKYEPSEPNKYKTRTKKS